MRAYPLADCTQVIMASKEIKSYICRECGYITSKWLGKCPSCSTWDSFDLKVTEKPQDTQSTAEFSQAVRLTDVETDSSVRFKTGMSELDRVLGGGLVEGSLVLIGGDPGIGKSTLMMQISKYFSDGGKKVLYVSGEESMSQIKLRAMRLKINTANIFLLAETDTDVVVAKTLDERPDFLVIDSVQTMNKREISSVPGSVAQVREATSAFMSLAKKEGIPVFIVGHVTKDGNIAGPKILEHMVDTVLYFEGNSDHSFRILRAVKNRFGPTNEIAVFDMGQNGLTEILNPSELFVSKQSADVPGSVITASVNGTMPVLVEVQALVSSSSYEGRAKCIVGGLDFNKVSLICAVLQNRLGIDILSKDIFVNIAGGLKITEPAADLACALAVYTANRNITMPKRTCVFGEVGLAGEVRGVPFAEKRISEAVKMGFKRLVIPKDNAQAADDFADDVEICTAGNLREAAEWIINSRDSAKHGGRL